MHKMLKAYLFEGGTVVTDKKTIVNSKDKHYEEVTLILSSEEIQQYYEELEELNMIAAEGDN